MFIDINGPQYQSWGSSILSIAASMQSDYPNAVSHNLRTVTDNHTDLRAGRGVEPDTRRFAGIFPLEVPEPPAHSGHATREEHEARGNDSDSGYSDPSQWEFVSMLDTDTFSTQATSVATVDKGSTLSAAQQVAVRYRAVHRSDTPDSATMRAEEKVLPQIPDDQRSMYTLATSAETQSTMDMMWKPKPKVHMRRTDQRALMQAQTQALAMMHNAGLKPTNKIQCRRRGCADILQDVEALKYHIHIHNIADAAARDNDAPPSAAWKPSLVECHTSDSKTSKRSRHSRSKSSLGTQHSCSTPRLPPRKLSASGLLPSLFSPRESTPEAQPIFNLATIAATLVSGPSSSNSSAPPSVCNNSKAPSTHVSTPSRGRRTRKESKPVSASSECHPSIAMLLSPPSSPRMQGRLVLASHTNSPMPPELYPDVDGENDGQVRNENAVSVSEKLSGSRSPMRALSPTRAMSPIRNGIRRVLSLGYSVDFTDK